MESLKEYHKKRRFGQTPEPSGEMLNKAPEAGNRFVVQKHDARRLHYDFRLEIEGVLKSWAVPKGPSLNPGDKRLAMQTEDHPLDYAGFEGVIPKGEYGAGPVMVWDRGTFEVEGDLSALKQLERGDLKFTLHGEKLRGSFVLVKIRSSGASGKAGKNEKPWLLIKHKDAAVDTSWDVEEHDGSVLSGRSLKEIEEELPPLGASAGPGPETLEGARSAKMPTRLEPMLAVLSEKLFSHPDWLFEIKWDGVRALAWIKQGELELRARSGRLITASYPELAQLPSRLRADEAILDGEIVTLDESGRSSFERLQSRMHVLQPSPALLRQFPVIYYLFDILYCDGYDLRDVPLLERKQLLRQKLEPGDPFRYADHVVEKGRQFFELAQQQGLEGILGKQLYSAYAAGARSPSWLKFKITAELDVVIGGWTAPRGSREHFGALLAGLYEGKALRFIGGVGTGFTENLQREVFRRLEKLKTDRCPFDNVPETKEKSVWVKPELVARVKYGNWTDERRLRAPVFVGLREDVEPKECRFEDQAPIFGKQDPHLEGRPDKLERPAQPPASMVSAPALAGKVLSDKASIERELFHGRGQTLNVEIDGRVLRFSNLNKLYFPESGYTKRNLLAYYYRVAEYILPFLKDRPLVLRRYPNGITGQSFFQKDAGEVVPEWMKTVGLASEGKREEIRYFLANDRPSLLYLTNLGCIDHNPFSSRVDDIDHPDYFFFDLDPSQGTDFDTVLTIARAIHHKLETLGLTAFMKTSGATGFHMYLPVEPGYTYEQVRTFADIVGRIVAAEQPKLVTQERVVEKRPRGTVLIDAYQNSSGRPLAAVYSVRAFAHAPVSAPVAPEELEEGLRPERLNIETLFPRLEERGDLWRDFWKKRQPLERAIDKLAELHRA